MRLRNLILDLVTIKKVRYNNLYIKNENKKKQVKTKL